VQSTGATSSERRNVKLEAQRKNERSWILQSAHHPNSNLKTRLPCCASAQAYLSAWLIAAKALVFI
jgi:hypothetical protein